MKITGLIVAALLSANAFGEAVAVSWASAAADPTIIGDASNGPSYATAVNNSGVVAGYGLVNKKNALDINASGDSAGPDAKLNDAGHQVNVYQTNSLAAQWSTLTSGATVTTLGNLGGNGPLGVPYTIVGDINNSDYVCGQSMASNGKQHAFIRSPGGTMTDLGTLDGSGGTSWASAINDSKWVAGSSTSSGDGIHAVVWKDTGEIVDLGPGIAFGINSSNQVVGIKFTGSGDRAFSWTAGGGLVTLAVPAGAVHTYAQAVNDTGLIVGWSQ